jgi:hypothetical protein
MNKPKFRKLRKSYPEGVCGIYDNGGRSADRYTAVFDPFRDEMDGRVYWYYLAMSAHPFHPQGAGISDCTVGFRPGSCGNSGWSNACGKVIEWEDLPEDCQTAVKNWLEE